MLFGLGFLVAYLKAPFYLAIRIYRLNKNFQWFLSSFSIVLDIPLNQQNFEALLLEFLIESTVLGRLWPIFPMNLFSICFLYVSWYQSRVRSWQDAIKKAPS